MEFQEYLSKFRVVPIIPARNIYGELRKLGLTHNQTIGQLAHHAPEDLRSLLYEVKKTDCVNKAARFMEWAKFAPKVKRVRQLHIRGLFPRKIGGK